MQYRLTCVFGERRETPSFDVSLGGTAMAFALYVKSSHYQQ